MERSEGRQAAKALAHGAMARPGQEAMCAGSQNPNSRPSARASSWIPLGMKLGSAPPSSCK